MVVLLVMALVGMVLVGMAAALGWWLGRRGLDAARLEASSLRTALEYERAASDDKLAVLDESRQRFEQAFAALSAEALQRNNQQFLDLAAATLESTSGRAAADLDARREAVEHVVAPLRETLSKVEQQLHNLEAARAGAYAGVLEQVNAVRQSSDRLRTETATLVAALRRPTSRGAWGEMSLRRVVEAAGMNEHCDFLVQPSMPGSDGVQRPDLVVRLAGGRTVVVDSKVPLDAFLDAIDEPDETRRGRLWKEHAGRLRAHVDGLAGKAYWQRCPGSPEFVVLFVPQEAFLAPALEADPSLLDHAAARRVVLATPTTLIALLRTVAHAWTQQALAENARAVYETGRELYSRLATMGEHVEKLGRSLNAAVGSYNRTVGSLEGRVLVTARRFASLGLVSDEIPAPEGVDASPRRLVSPELTSDPLPGADVLPLVHRTMAGPGAGPPRSASGGLAGSAAGGADREGDGSGRSAASGPTDGSEGWAAG